jgi:hypothetical protein
MLKEFMEMEQHLPYGRDLVMDVIFSPYTTWNGILFNNPLIFVGRKTILYWRAAQWNSGTYRGLRTTL